MNFEFYGRDGIASSRDILTYGGSEDNRIDEFHSELRKSNGKLVELYIIYLYNKSTHKKEVYYGIC